MPKLFRVRFKVLKLIVIGGLTLNVGLLQGQQAELEPPPGLDASRAAPLTEAEKDLAREIVTSHLIERGIELEDKRIFQAGIRLVRHKEGDSRLVRVSHYRYEDDGALLSTVDLQAEEVIGFKVVRHKPVPLAEAELDRARDLAIENEEVRNTLGDRIGDIEIEPLGIPTFPEGDPLFGHRVVDLLFREGGAYVDLRVTVDLTEGTVLVHGGEQSKDKAFHPADNNPSDWRIEADEATAYGAAWKTGQSWPVGPDPILIDYVTRAGFLWKSGESYTTLASEQAPLKWVPNEAAESSLRERANRKPGAFALSSAGSQVVQSIRNTNRDSDASSVKISVNPSDGIEAYAIQEQVPEGWHVTEISHDGAFLKGQSTIRWGPFYDEQVRELSFEVINDSSGHGQISLHGTASFDGRSMPIDEVRLIQSPEISILEVGGGEISLKVEAVANADFVIETSTNLKEWEVVQEGELSAEKARISFPVNEGKSRAYYRLKLR